jgi:hypothetical protein
VGIGTTCGRSPGKLNVTLDLGSPHPDEQYLGVDGIGWLEGRTPAHVVPHYWDKEPAIVHEPTFGLRFAAGLAVRVDGGVVHSTGEGTLRVEGNSSVPSPAVLGCHPPVGIRAGGAEWAASGVDGLAQNRKTTNNRTVTCPVRRPRLRDVLASAGAQADKSG